MPCRDTRYSFKTVVSTDLQKELQSLPRGGTLIAKKYRVEKVIGHGGMGAVLAATHRKLNQRVAIKILYPTSARSPEAVARFLREAQAAASLQNEHVVRILDFGRHTDGLPFMVMEYLQGQNLAELLALKGVVSVDEAIQYVMQASEAVAEAHATGIVHRDIKSANLFLTTSSDGSPFIKVLDFGISKAEWMMGSGAYQPDLTATADTLGTPIYMSPEQVRSTKHVTAQADIWALGVVLYELLAGVPPFWADSLPALSAKIVVDPPVPLSARRLDLPDGLDAMVLWCLEKEPANRPASIVELARALEPFAPDVTAGWVERIERIVEQTKSHVSTARLAPMPMLQPEALQAWGNTQALRRNLRGGLLGLALGASAALVAGGIWWMFTSQGTAPLVAGSVASKSVVSTGNGDVSPSGLPLGIGPDAGSDAGSDAGKEGLDPARVTSSAESSPAPPPRTGPRSDPLGERY